MNEIERLWNGWRNSYVSSLGSDTGTKVGRGSIFSGILSSGEPDDVTNIVHRGRSVFVILNAFPYAVGHLLVLPYREVSEVEDLTAEESTELWSTVTASVRALKVAYRPDGLNVGLNLGQSAGGSVSQHLHVHVLPRWTGDVNFMAAVANTRTLPEALGDTATRIRAAWPR